MSNSQIFPQISEGIKDYKCFTVRLLFDSDNAFLFIEIYDNERKFFCYDVLEQEVLFYRTYPSLRNLTVLNVILQRIDSRFIARLTDRIIIEVAAIDTILNKRKITRFVSSHDYFLNTFALRSRNYPLTEFLQTKVEEGLS